MNYSPTVLEIDASAIRHNLHYFKSNIVKNTKILAVVKAFGYGSDAVEVAKLIEPEVSYFAVAYCHEGIRLKKAGITKPILVLHPQDTNLELIIDNKLEPNLYHINILNKFLSLAEKNRLKSYPVHIKFNTGLNRLGFSKEQVGDIASLLKDQKSLNVISVFSHLAASEDLNEHRFSLQQISKFKDMSLQFEQLSGIKPIRHMTNTSGVLNYPEAHFDMIRIGIGLYGLSNGHQASSNLKNVLTLKSSISQINQIKKGESVGYNRALVSDKPMKTATIPIGHADGISRRLGNGNGFVRIFGQKAPIVGNVCMDMLMVDVSKIDCNIGDEVVIFDDQHTIESLAKDSDTISYELIAAISQRVKRKIIHIIDL